ncbi:MAG: hypothetical protein HAW61_00330, partial [Candidatus Portiera sp.]|nr:hypothetical protein [Portiera sp.]
AFIPDDYIEDLMERVRIYKQLATGNREAVENIKKQMLDRYGSLPLYATNLFEFYRMKFDAQDMGIKSLKISRSRGYAVIDAQHQKTLQACTEIAKKYPADYVIQSASLHFRSSEATGEEQLLTVGNLLKLLQNTLNNLPANYNQTPNQTPDQIPAQPISQQSAE